MPLGASVPLEEVPLEEVAGADAFDEALDAGLAAGADAFDCASAAGTRTSNQTPQRGSASHIAAECSPVPWI